MASRNSTTIIKKRLGAPTWMKLIENKYMSSTCHANVARHIPKYRYGVLTPGKLLLLNGKRWVNAEGKYATFRAVISSVNKEPSDTVSK